MLEDHSQEKENLARPMLRDGRLLLGTLERPGWWSYTSKSLVLYSLSFSILTLYTTKLLNTIALQPNKHRFNQINPGSYTALTAEYFHLGEVMQ